MNRMLALVEGIVVVASSGFCGEGGYPSAGFQGVTRMRHVSAGKPITALIYAKWKDLQRRASLAMLKFHNPEKAAIPTFDDADLDI